MSEFNEASSPVRDNGSVSSCDPCNGTISGPNLSADAIACDLSGPPFPGVRGTGRAWGWVVVIGVVCCLASPRLLQAEELRWESIGLRGGVSGSSPIGKKETQYFKEYDLMANWSLPWGWYSDSGWGVGTRLMGSVGALGASDDTAFIATIVPGLVFGKKDGWLSLEVGAGAALLSMHHFANQDMGGAFQVVGDIALRAKVYGGIGVGYWFHHLSDATLYGDHGRGFDLHMLELSYRFW